MKIDKINKIDYNLVGTCNKKSKRVKRVQKTLRNDQYLQTPSL